MSRNATDALRDCEARVRALTREVGSLREDLRREVKRRERALEQAEQAERRASEAKQEAQEQIYANRKLGSELQASQDATKQAQERARRAEVALQDSVEQVSTLECNNIRYQRLYEETLKNCNAYKAQADSLRRQLSDTELQLRQTEAKLAQAQLKLTRVSCHVADSRSELQKELGAAMKLLKIGNAKAGLEDEGALNGPAGLARDFSPIRHTLLQQRQRESFSLSQSHSPKDVEDLADLNLQKDLEAAMKLVKQAAVFTQRSEIAGLTSPRNPPLPSQLQAQDQQHLQVSIQQASGHAVDSIRSNQHQVLSVSRHGITNYAPFEDQQGCAAAVVSLSPSAQRQRSVATYTQGVESTAHGHDAHCTSPAAFKKLVAGTGLSGFSTRASTYTENLLHMQSSGHVPEHQPARRIAIPTQPHSNLGLHIDMRIGRTEAQTDSHLNIPTSVLASQNGHIHAGTSPGGGVQQFQPDDLLRQLRSTVYTGSNIGTVPSGSVSTFPVASPAPGNATQSSIRTAQNDRPSAHLNTAAIRNTITNILARVSPNAGVPDLGNTKVSSIATSAPVHDSVGRFNAAEITLHPGHAQPDTNRSSRNASSTGSVNDTTAHTTTVMTSSDSSSNSQADGSLNTADVHAMVKKLAAEASNTSMTSTMTANSSSVTNTSAAPSCHTYHGTEPGIDDGSLGGLIEDRKDGQQDVDKLLLDMRSLNAEIAALEASMAM